MNIADKGHMIKLCLNWNFGNIFYIFPLMKRQMTRLEEWFGQKNKIQNIDKLVNES